MSIVFRDELGYIAVDVDEYGVQFADGVAYFSDTKGKEYTVQMEYLVAVTNERGTL